MASFVPYPAGMYELLESPVGEVGRDSFRRGEKLLAEAVRRCPVGKTQNLRKGLQVHLDGVKAVLTSDQPYAEFVVRGTRPHVIEPTKARVLAFESGGGYGGGDMVFAMRVNHPGTKPNNFALDALEAATR